MAAHGRSIRSSADQFNQCLNVNLKSSKYYCMNTYQYLQYTRRRYGNDQRRGGFFPLWNRHRAPRDSCGHTEAVLGAIVAGETALNGEGRPRGAPAGGSGTRAGSPGRRSERAGPLPRPRDLAEVVAVANGAIEKSAARVGAGEGVGNSGRHLVIDVAAPLTKVTVRRRVVRHRRRARIAVEGMARSGQCRADRSRREEVSRSPPRERIILSPSSSEQERIAAVATTHSAACWLRRAAQPLPKRPSTPAARREGQRDRLIDAAGDARATVLAATVQAR